jgi:hypothetical protein
MARKGSLVAYAVSAQRKSGVSGGWHGELNAWHHQQLSNGVSINWRNQQYGGVATWRMKWRRSICEAAINNHGGVAYNIEMRRRRRRKIS